MSFIFLLHKKMKDTEENIYENHENKTKCKDNNFGYLFHHLTLSVRDKTGNCITLYSITIHQHPHIVEAGGYQVHFLLCSRMRGQNHRINSNCK